MIIINGVWSVPGLKTYGDIDLGGNKLKTEYQIIRSGEANFLYIRDSTDSEWRGIKFGSSRLASGFIQMDDGTALKGYGTSTASFTLQSYNGSAYVTNLKLIGGNVEIYGGKLTSGFNANFNSISNIIIAEFTHNQGIWRGDKYDAVGGIYDLGLGTINTSGAVITRIFIPGNVDIADILIKNAHLKADVANSGAIGIEPYVADYGGGFANFVPPTGFEGRIIVAIDTNATTPGKRIYVYANAAWNYVNLT